MKPPAASPGRAEKQLPAPGLARLLLSKSRGRSRHGSAAAARSSPMFVSRSRSAGRAAASVAAAAEGEPSSPKVTCIGQVRMRKSKNGKKQPAPEKRGYCRCLKKAFFCGGLFGRKHPKSPPVAAAAEAERNSRSAARRSPWVSGASRSYGKKEVEFAMRSPDPRRDKEDGDEEVAFGLDLEEAEEVEDDKEGEKAAFVSSATTTPPKNALLLMRCRSAPQNRASPLTSRFPVAAPSSVMVANREEVATAAASPEMEEKRIGEEAEANTEKVDEKRPEQEQEEDNEEEEEEEEEMRCSSARPLVLPRCKSEPATTAAAKMAATTPAEATTGCFWANGGSSGRRRQAPAAVSVALAGH